MFIIYFIFVGSRRERRITAAKEVEDLRNVLWYAGILLLLVASIGLIAFFNTVSYGAGEMRSRGDDGNIEFSRDNDYILYYINKVKRIKIFFFLLFIVCTCKSEVWLRCEIAGGDGECLKALVEVEVEVEVELAGERHLPANIARMVRQRLEGFLLNLVP